MQEKIALPTVGRIVLFFDAAWQADPMPMMVTKVDGYTINGTVFEAEGGTASVVLIKHISEANGAPHWDWMDFQKGQAAKTEALQVALDKKLTGSNSLGPTHHPANAQSHASEIIGVNITYGPIPVCRHELPKVLLDELDKIPVQR